MTKKKAILKKKHSVDLSNATVSLRSNYGNVIQAIIKAGHCPFCGDNLHAHHQKPIIRQGTFWTVTYNNWPYEGTARHFLLISVPHIEAIEEASPESWSELQSHLSYLQKKFRLPGKSLLIRSGAPEMTGASVRHLHAQVIVGTKRSRKSGTITALVGFKK